MTQKVLPLFLACLVFLFLSGCTADPTGKVTYLAFDSNGGSSDTNQVKVSANDTTPNYLFSKLAAGPNVSLAILNPGANEQVQITATSSSGSDTNKVAVSASDTVPDFLFSKLQAGTGISLAIQNSGGDENVLITATGSTTDTNCSNNPNCILTGRLNSNFDANMMDLNVDDIHARGSISGADFNQSILDHNDSFSCPAGQAIQTIGNTTACISVTSSSSGRTYTSGTPATIEVNNDSNTISQNYDGNFWSRFTPANDGNFYSKFGSSFDSNFWSRFTSANDGNYFTRFQANFDGNFVTKINALDLNNSLNYAKKTDGNGSILGTTNQVSVSNGLSRLFKDTNVVLSLPQNIDTAASPTFIGLTLSPCGTFQADTSPQIRFKVDCGASLVTSATIIPAQAGISDIGNASNRWDDLTVSDINTTGDTRVHTFTADSNGFIKKLSVDDLNASIADLNDSQSCPAGQALQSVGNSTSCISVPSSTGRTYMSGTPGTIEVNNDANTISQNFDGNFTFRFDGNFFTKFKPVFDSNFQRAFDGNFQRAFDGNFLRAFDANFQRSFDGNFNIQFKKSFDGNFIPAFDANFKKAFDANYYPRNALLFPVPDANILNASLYKATCDNNALCTITGTINTNIDANFNDDVNIQGNLTLDANVNCKDANCIIGRPDNQTMIYNGLGFIANTSQNGTAVLTNAQTWVFCVGTFASGCGGSGLFFNNINPRGFEFQTTNIPQFRLGIGNGLGAYWMATRTVDPTAGSLFNFGGTQYVKDTGTTNPWDGNILMINQGNASSLNYTPVGSRIPGSLVVQTDANIGRDLNAHRNLYVDGNFLHGGHWSLFSVIGTSCNTLCGAITVDAPWTCAQAITTAGGASTCSQTLVAVNCLCKN